MIGAAAREKRKRRATYAPRCVLVLPDQLEACATRPSDDAMFFPFDHVPAQPPPVPKGERCRSGAKAQRERHQREQVPCAHFRLHSGKCQAMLFRSATMQKQMREWRRGWEQCDLTTRRTSLLRHIHACRKMTMVSPQSTTSTALSDNAGARSFSGGFVHGRGDSGRDGARQYGTPVATSRIMWSF